ncbi:MAG TPA: hypothetical protein VKA84_23575, partial [Gemmatimonadaceae bacterium]|nr:hypothetical protein [Gemmatimonadaceae bacterium]
MTAAPRSAPRAASSGTGIGPSFAPSSGGAPPPPPDGRSRKLVSPKPLARLLPLVRPYAPRLAVAALCLVVAGGAQLVFPQTVRHLLDAAFQQR